MLLEDWRRLRARHGFRIGARFLPRALLTTLSAASTSRAARREHRLWGARVAAVEPPAPLFILGHYRSGTTHLHNLIARDRRFGFVNNYRAAFPHTFLTTEATGSRLGAAFTLRKRPHDNVRLDLGQPAEDELALCAMTGLSPHLAWHFPRQGLELERRYLTFADAEPAERRRWVEALRLLAAKVAAGTGCERLVFKSPLHTARIPLLLEAFPEAVFVHLHRDPVRVFQSTRHMEQKVEPLFRFQESRPLSVERPDELDERILWRYRAMLEAYLRDRHRVAAGRLVEVAYRDLDRRPMETLERLYREIELPAFDTARPAVETYLRSLAAYRKNAYPPLDRRLAARVREEWRSAFAEWNYVVS